MRTDGLPRVVRKCDERRLNRGGTTTLDRSAAASVAINARLAQVGGASVAAPATAGRWARYLYQVDPYEQLTEAERHARARFALRTDMRRLAARSVSVRQDKRAVRDLLALSAELAAMAAEIEARLLTKGAARGA